MSACVQVKYPKLICRHNYADKAVWLSVLSSSDLLLRYNLRSALSVFQ